MTKIRFATTATFAVLALASAGAIAISGPRVDNDKPAMKRTAGAAGVSQEQPLLAKPAETLEVNGRVLAPDGRPVAGAAVAAVYASTHKDPWPKATSGPDGRFSIHVRNPEPPADSYSYVVASASGYGIGRRDTVERADGTAQAVVTLVEEGPPIEGRILDLEGRPIVGASVDTSRIWYDKKENIAGWIAKARNGATADLWQGMQTISLEAKPSKLGRSR